MFLQRLFSTFAGGWPGLALLLQRLLTAAVLFYYGINCLRETPQLAVIIPQMIGAASGILLLVGVWTPVIGIVVAVVEVWSVFLRFGDPWIHVMLAVLSATLAMIGPGAWSIDAGLYGRKRIEPPRR